MLGVRPTTADHETIAWLQYLYHFNPRAPLLVIATLRTKEVASQDQVNEFLATLRANNQLTELLLQPLTKAETALLVQQTIGGALDEVIINRLYVETEGNPLFIVEMAQLPPTQPGRATDSVASNPKLPA